MARDRTYKSLHIRGRTFRKDDMARPRLRSHRQVRDRAPRPEVVEVPRASQHGNTPIFQVLARDDAPSRTPLRDPTSFYQG